MRMLRLSGLASALVLLLFSGILWAQGELAPAAADPVVLLTRTDLDTLWTLVAAFLVFFMNAGFALVESGFCRAKNVVNIMAKNFVVFAIASIAFWVAGFALMFGDGNPVVGTNGFMVDETAGPFESLAWTSVPLYAKFLFQLVFCATAATIVSGAVAERIKFHAYIIFSFLLTGLVYPIAGHWIWGGGFLAGLGFCDFAGSTVVHSIGGWAALAGVMVLGARIGKYRKDGSVHPIPGHNMALATLGGLILWLGWFGFNPGSTMAANGAEIARIAMTTNLAAAAGIASSTIVAWAVLKKPDLGMIVNGALAGLVAITASCAWVSPGGALMIGLVAGALVVLGVVGFDRLHIDDPVGALSVHLVNGVFGTLAVGVFAHPAYATGDGAPQPGLLYGGGFAQLLAQFAGVIVVGAAVFGVSLGLWHLIRLAAGLRVSAEEELQGLDVTEMGMEAYPHDSVVASPG